MIEVSCVDHILVAQRGVAAPQLSYDIWTLDIFELRDVMNLCRHWNGERHWLTRLCRSKDFIRPVAAALEELFCGIKAQIGCAPQFWMIVIGLPMGIQPAGLGKREVAYLVLEAINLFEHRVI